MTKRKYKDEIASSQRSLLAMTKKGNGRENAPEKVTNRVFQRPQCKISPSVNNRLLQQFSEFLCIYATLQARNLYHFQYGRHRFRIVSPDYPLELLES